MSSSLASIAETAQNVQLLARFFCLDVGSAALAMCVDSVSYTHLRAHETVLDLVCRLLLEKKKTLPDYLSIYIFCLTL